MKIGKIVNGIFLMLGAIIVMTMSAKDVLGLDVSDYIIPGSLITIGLWLLLDGGIKHISDLLNRALSVKWKSIFHLISIGIGFSAVILGIGLLIPMVGKMTIVSTLLSYSKTIQFMAGTWAIAEAIENFM